jgi:hypothetical protein
MEPEGVPCTPSYGGHGAGFFKKRRASAFRVTTGQLVETARGNSYADHAFFCNFLLTKALPQFNMAVDKTGNGKEVGKKPTIIDS